MRKEVQQHISKTDKTDTPNFQMPDNCRVGIEPHLICESCRPCHHYTIGNNQSAFDTHHCVYSHIQGFWLHPIRFIAPTSGIFDGL